MKKDLIMTIWHVIPVKAENVLSVIEKIVPIMHATNHQNSGVMNVIVTFLEQIVIDITKSHPTKTRKPRVTFSPNVPNAAKSSNTPGRRKTKEEKNTNALSLSIPYAKKTYILEPTNVSFNLPKRNDLDTLKKNEMLASNNYSVKASLCQRWTLMN